MITENNITENKKSEIKKQKTLNEKRKIKTNNTDTHQTIAPLWRQIRAEFKANSIKNLKGCILTQNFISALDNNGLSINKNDLKCIITHFRGNGNSDVVKYDEFLRMCLLTKDQVPTD